MPKLKVHKTATKRFKITGKRKIFRNPGSTSHLRRSETTSQHKRKEGFRAVKKVDLKRVRRLIGGKL